MKMESFNSSYFVQPPICASGDDYSALITAVSNRMSDGIRPVEDIAKEQCPQLCTKLHYTIQLQVPGNDKPDKAAFYFENQHTCSWEVVMTTDSVQVTSQFYLYNVGSLIGELGGSWGLFLGASFITLLDLTERLIKLARFSRKLN
jgi:hypothetical protein